MTTLHHLSALSRGEDRLRHASRDTPRLRRRVGDSCRKRGDLRRIRAA
jgi:hypothetical protein